MSGKKKLISFQGRTLSQSAWAEALGISRQALWNRLRRLPKADALRDEKGRRLVRRRKTVLWIQHQGVIMSCTQAAKHLHVTQATIRKWVKDGNLTAYSERVMHCSKCGSAGHTLRQCPEVYLPAAKAAPSAPPAVRARADIAGALVSGAASSRGVSRARGSRR